MTLPPYPNLDCDAFCGISLYFCETSTLKCTRGTGYEVAGNIQPPPRSPFFLRRFLLSLWKMSASIDTDYPWLQEHLRDLTHDKAQAAKHQEMVDAGLVYPFDLENPAGCWVELVMASRIQDHNARKQQVLKWVALARTSRWNREMLFNMEDDDSEPEVEYGGPFQDTAHSQTVKDLLDAADAEACKEIAGGLPATPPFEVEDSEPMTEPFGEE